MVGISALIFFTYNVVICISNYLCMVYTIGMTFGSKKNKTESTIQGKKCLPVKFRNVQMFSLRLLVRMCIYCVSESRCKGM